MAALYSYGLGTTFPPTNVEDLSINPPKGRFYEASVFNDKSDGHVAGHGSAYAVWEFGILTQTMINALRVICPGYSANVYIRTRRNDGSFEDYSAIMLWPARDQMDKRNFGGRYIGLEFQFRQLEVVTSQLSFYKPENSGYILLLS